ncbi:MAG: formylglycine-generating enzyme family protein, partial [Planctomycetota bacterium]
MTAKVGRSVVLFLLGMSGIAGCRTPPPGTEPEPASSSKEEVYTGWPFDAAEAKRRQKKTAERLGVPVEKAVDLEGGLAIKLVLVPAGEFTMGSNEGGEDAKPVHKVTITNPFYMGRHEVTQAQYEKLTGTNPSAGKGATRPVENVSWSDAGEFCSKLSELVEGIVRLPSEAEWEYACRAGTATKWCFGDEGWNLSEYGWYCDSSGIESHPVGEKPANAWGLQDMHGNVAEWCEDWYDKRYEDGAAIDPTGPTSGTFRVFRGGSYVNDIQ